MKLIREKILVFLLVLVMVIGAVSVITPIESVNAATKPKLSKTSVIMVKGQTTTLRVKNTASKIIWKSSKPTVAKVSKGKIKALKKGTTTISAKVNGVTLKCKVEVEEPKLSATEIEVYPYQDYELKIEGCSHKVRWKSLAHKLVSVENGVIHPEVIGTTYVEAFVHGQPYICTVTVKQPDADDYNYDDYIDDDYIDGDNNEYNQEGGQEKYVYEDEVSGAIYDSKWNRVDDVDENDPFFAEIEGGIRRDENGRKYVYFYAGNGAIKFYAPKIMDKIEKKTGNYAFCIFSGYKIKNQYVVCWFVKGHHYEYLANKEGKVLRRHKSDGKGY